MVLVKSICFRVSWVSSCSFAASIPGLGVDILELSYRPSCFSVCATAGLKHPASPKSELWSFSSTVNPAPPSQAGKELLSPTILEQINLFGARVLNPLR